MIDRARFWRLFRYAVVGAIAFIIDFLLTLELAKSIHYVVANSIGFIFANATNFLLAHGFVFDRQLTLKEVKSAYPLVLLISVLGLLLSDVMIYFFKGVVGFDLALAKILTTVLVLLWNFFARERLVYIAR